MGGRGSTFGRGGTSAGGPINVLSTTSLISARERQTDEVDKVLTVLRDLNDQYGAEINDVQIVTIAGPGAVAMAYYDADGNLAFNKSYFDDAKMEAAYDRCVTDGFHPSKGSKSALEAVAAHEMGHRLTDMAATKAGYGAWQLDRVAGEIIRTAAKSLGQSPAKLMGAISGYAKENAAEAVAEAFADVYCNGGSAAAASRAVVQELHGYLRR